MNPQDRIKFRLEMGDWALKHEDAIAAALKESFHNRPTAMLTKFEKALDDMPVMPASIHVNPEEKFW